MLQSEIDSAAHQAATSPKNDLPEPTPEQIKAGNYAKGHVTIHGLNIAIENPKGSKRSGVSKDGKAWETVMKHHYGYIKRSEGADDDHVDVFIGDKPESRNVYVVNQVNPETGVFDEHKVMLCFEDREEAAEAYLSNYEAGWKGMGDMVYMPMDDFREWLEYGDTKTELILEDAHSRESIRAFLESINPKRIRALKNESYREYLAILKSIVRKLFPSGAKIKFRKNGREIDYEHFLKDFGRSKYIHSLPDTLKKSDIQIELEDQQKQYLIKKYFDPEIQKDIWDILVFHGDEIRTKIARSGRKGAGYIEKLMYDVGAGNEASRSATKDGVTESASTHPMYDSNITPYNDQVNLIFEMAEAEWRAKLTRSDDIDDISEVFRALFQEPPSSGSPFFKDTFTSQVVSLDKLVPREEPNPDRVKRAHAKMSAAKAGTGEKRAPVKVFDMGNGKFKVLDGNTTLQALKELGEAEVVVEVKKSLKQQVSDSSSLDAVYEQAEKALPTFKEWVEKYGQQTGASQIMLRPGLKGRERAGAKVKNDYAGVASRLTDIVGGTLLFDTVEQVVAAYKAIIQDKAVYKAKNRFEKPTSDGYRDIMMVVNVGGHLCELQLNTHAILDAKEKGLGHKLYEITRELEPIAKQSSGDGDFDFVAQGYIDALRKVSVKVYRNAAMSSSSSSASSMASDSETLEEFNRILARLSGSSISDHFSGLRESIRKMSPVNFSIAKGTSSFSTKSNTSDFMSGIPPFDTENITRNGKKVNAKVLTGRLTRAYLNDGSLLKLQYAIVDAASLVTSHNTDFTLHPEFPQELQPRDRTRDTMRQQIASIAGKLNPDLLGGSLYASVGSPIIGRDLVVESGNGRTMGIKTRYERDDAPHYREWLINEVARKIGIDAEQVLAMDRPVLVRIRLSDENRTTVTERANEGDIASMSPMEQAKVDSRRLTEDDLDVFRPSDDGDITAASNRQFVQNFIKKLGPAESAGLLTADSRPTKKLVDRIQASIFSKAYDNDKLLALMAEETHPTIKNILTALTLASPVFAKIRGVAPDMGGINLTEHVVGAAMLILKSRDESAPIEMILNQIGMFEQIPEETKAVARLLHANMRSAKRMGNVFKSAGQRILTYLQNRDQISMFGAPGKPTAVGVLKEALSSEEADGVKQRGLFESAGDQGIMEQFQFPLKRVESAYSHLHMSPRNTAKVEEEQLNRNADEIRQEITKYMPGMDTKDVDDVILKFKQDYVKARESVWNAASSAYSGAVAGQSNLDVRLVARRGTALDKAESAFSKWLNAESERIESMLGIDNLKADEAKRNADKKAETKQTRRINAVKAWMALKPGDVLDVGNTNGNPVVKKKSKLSVETGSGAKWTLKELLGIDHSEASEIMRQIEAGAQVDSNASPDASGTSAPSGEGQKEPWQMTREEWTYQYNEELYQAIRQAIADGKDIAVATQYRHIPLKSTEHIRIAQSGTIQIPSGKGKWASLTSDQVHNLAVQAGVDADWKGRFRHAEAVEHAISEGKPVPDAVVRGYPHNPHIQWRMQIQNAKAIEHISGVFEDLFGVYLEETEAITQ